MRTTSKSHRCEQANKLIKIIAAFGRNFFKGAHGVAQFQLDKRGRVWFLDDYAQKLIYTHYRGRWRHFTHGGTLKRLIEHLRDYIAKGTAVPAGILGPWPKWCCGGDLWGYGKDMQSIRASAYDLGIIEVQIDDHGDRATDAGSMFLMKTGLGKEESRG